MIKNNAPWLTPGHRITIENGSHGIFFDGAHNCWCVNEGDQKYNRRIHCENGTKEIEQIGECE